MELQNIKDSINQSIGELVKNGSVITCIDTHDQAVAAKQLGNACAKLAKELDAKRLADTQPLRDEVEEINKLYKTNGIDVLQSIVNNIKTMVKQFDERMELEQKEQQRIADEAAEKDRRRIQAIADEQRAKEDALRKEAAEKEAKAQEEAIAAQKLLDDAKNIEDETERKKQEALAQEQFDASNKLKADAEKLETRADGWGDKANLKTDIANSIVAPVVQSVSKGYTPIYKYRALMSTIDKRKFIEYCLKDNPFDSLEFLTINEVHLNKIINSFKGNIKLDGVEVEKYDVGRLK